MYCCDLEIPFETLPLTDVRYMIQMKNIELSQCFEQLLPTIVLPWKQTTVV